MENVGGVRKDTGHLADMYKDSIDRFFSFGCSFTKYKWPTWADIIAYDLNCTYYNFGKSGAGNMYISNIIAQADNFFQFNKHDLVVICWTNVFREDRYTSKQEWILPGNLSTQQIYDRKFVRKYNSIEHCLLRDYAQIYFVYQLLKSKTNLQFLCMINPFDIFDQFDNTIVVNKKLDVLKNTYSSIIDIMPKDYYAYLWNNNLENKKADCKKIHKYFDDCHPTPNEHLKYIQHVSNYNFSKSIEKIKAINNNMEEQIKDIYNITQSKDKYIYNFGSAWLESFTNATKLVESHDIPIQIIC